MAPWLGSSFDRTLPPEFRLMNLLNDSHRSSTCRPAPNWETGRGAGAMLCEILVVEDDEDLRESLAQALSANGHIVRATEHGAKALELLSRGCRPGLILLDIMMPVMDGLRFLELKNADPLLASIPVVMMSATERRRHSGAADLVAKPMDLDDLERVIKQHYES